MTLTVQLPRAIADQVEELQETDPELLSRALMYVMMRRSIFEGLRLRQRYEDEQQPSAESGS